MVSLRRALPRTRVRRLLAALVALLVLAGVVTVVSVRHAVGGYHVRARTITVHTGPHGGTAVPLDTSLYVPDGAGAAHPAPAILLAHGFGGSKDSVAGDAKRLVGRGYVVLAWSAQGFGSSGGRIHLNSPDWEVTDARRLIDWLARRPEVRTDGPGDPRVGVVGASYGGALALLLAAYDQRVDAIVPQVTWHDLGRSLFAESSGRGVGDGVLKRDWLGALFGDGLSCPGGKGGTDCADPARVGACGRFADDICHLYQRVMSRGRADAATERLLARSSPAGVLDRIQAPTLLVQGLSDTLFGLSAADANARGIAKAGTTVRVAWFSGGHDGAASAADTDRVRRLTVGWLDHYLRGSGAAPDGFTFSRIDGQDYDGSPRTTALSAAHYPGLTGDRAVRQVPLVGPPQRVSSPPDGTPAAVSTLPGAGALRSRLTAREVPGQAARFSSAVLSHPVDLVGAPRVSLRLGSATGTAVVFAKLYDVGPDAEPTLVAGQAAPVRRTGLTGTPGAPVTVTLPGMVHRFAAGHRIQLVVDTADRAYAGPTRPANYTVSVAGPLRAPRVTASPLRDPAGIWYRLLAGLLVLLLVATAVVWLIARYRRRRRQRAVADDYADVPLAVRGLRKTYRNGFVAVRGVDFTVGRNQVVGLLGPNGAGKTTTLRMVLGLIRPTGGDSLLFGHRTGPGAPVLSRLGCLVEGPGFLPHLSGVDNLRMYWRATGRPWEAAGLDEVLAIADLGDAVFRKVRTYSHGMRQRLAIAQAMLGLPELLVLDEPTDGLDPPQIAEMRRVLQRYATHGRSVLVSSHLLAEVEQTCTHVVVLRRGERVAAGPVDEVIGDSPSVLVTVSDVDAAEPVLRALPGVASIARQDGGFVIDLAEVPRRDMVSALVSAGVGVDRVVPRRRLEDAFLALLERGD